MNRFIGTKIIHATPAPNPTTEEPGYKVVYADGYTSWSPTDVFEQAYRQCDAMTFGLAIEALKKGLKVARKGWNGKGMWLALSGVNGPNPVSAAGFWAKPNQEYAATLPNGIAKVLPCITMKTATGEILMGWLASQTDMLAEDWEIVE